MAQHRLSRATVAQGGWSVAPIVLNGVDLVNPLANPLIACSCGQYPGWYCDPCLTPLIERFSEAATPDARWALADELQTVVHDAVTFKPGGQFAGPPA